MKAISYSRFGPPAVLELVDIDIPRVGDDQIAVRVDAASVNSVDIKLRSGAYGPHAALPIVPGRDFSGTVISIGARTDRFHPGDEVVGVCDVSTQGSYAEIVVMSEHNLAHRPASVDAVPAAALALTGLTAAASIIDSLNIDEGEIVVVHGGAGGVGGAAIELAAKRGAEVWTTARREHHEALMALGAARAVDYRDPNAWRALSGADAVLDTIGGPDAAKNFELVRPGGRVAFIATGAMPPPPPPPDRTAIRPVVERTPASLARLARILGDGTLTPPPIRTFPLAQARLAHETFEAGGFRGKLVLVAGD